MLSDSEDLAMLVGTGNVVPTGVCHVSHPSGWPFTTLQVW